MLFVLFHNLQEYLDYGVLNYSNFCPLKGSIETIPSHLCRHKLNID